MGDEKLAGKWEGAVTAKLNGVTTEQVWGLLDDFFGLHKWNPSVDTCRRVDGSEETIRYCESTVKSEDTGETAVKWAKERLIETDPVGRRLTYEVQDNNVGFGQWVATVKVSGGGEGQNGNSGCEIVWSFVGEPVQGWTYQQVVSYYEFFLRSIADKFQHVSLLSPTLETSLKC